MRVYTGYDPREAAGWVAFVESLRRTSKDYELMPPLCGEQRDGSNTFTLVRWEIFERTNWAGTHIFLDGADMMLRAPIEELAALANPKYAIQVVKHDYQPCGRKYVGTSMECANEPYPRKQWTSVMIVNAGHPAHWAAREAIRAALERGDGKYLNRLEWLSEDLIGDLPKVWNLLVGEMPYNPQAKLVHFTNGIPAFDYYADCDYSEEWRAMWIYASRGLQYDIQRVSER